MNPAELIELTLDIGNRIDVQWGLFVTVHMALLGAITYIDEPLHRVEKAIAIIVYVGFAAINFAQMSAQLALLNAAYLDIVQLANDGNASELVKRMASDHDLGRHQYSEIVVRVSHGLMLILVSLAVAYHPLMTKKDQQCTSE